MQTIILSIEYDGTNYAGWQIQPNVRTVQQEIINSLFKISKNHCNLIGAGRTDAGVHAASQMAHFVCKEFPIPERKIALAINSKLSKDVFIKNAWIVNEPFHSRYDAIAREYKYRISGKYDVFKRFNTYYVPYKINLNSLNSSADIFLGKHDFSTFSKLHSNVDNYICHVEKCEWQKLDEYEYELTIKANRFLYGMVRAIAGIMLDVARGKKNIDEVKNALLLQNRSLASPLAAAHGLTLNKIYYPPKFDFIFKKMEED